MALAQYSKSIVALAVVVAAVGHALADGSFSGEEWAEIGTAVGALIGVFFIPNKAPQQ